MKIKIRVQFKDGIFNPEGDTIKRTLNKLGYKEIRAVSMEKTFVLDVDDTHYDEKRIKAIANDILSNPVIEKWEIVK